MLAQFANIVENRTPSRARPPAASSSAASPSSNAGNNVFNNDVFYNASPGKTKGTSPKGSGQALNEFIGNANVVNLAGLNNSARRTVNLNAQHARTSQLPQSSGVTSQGNQGSRGSRGSRSSQGTRSNRRFEAARRANKIVDPNYSPPTNDNLRASGNIPNNASLQAVSANSATNVPDPSGRRNNGANNGASRPPRRPHPNVPNNFMRGNLHGLQSPALCSGTGAVGSTAFQTCFDTAFKRLWRTQPGARPEAVCRENVLHRDQARLYETAKAIARSTTHRGQLVWANTGAGKTLMALCILLAYWDTGRRLVVITTHSNMKQNGAKLYADNLEKYFPAIAKRLKQRYGDVWKDQFRRHKTPADNNAKVLFYSQEKFVNNVLKDTKAHASASIKNGSFVLIVDEAHQLLEPPASPEPLRTAMIKLREQLLSPAFATERIHVWPLSATPASSVPQWLDMLSFVRPVKTPAFAMSRGRTVQNVVAAVARKSATAISEAVGEYARGTVFFSDMRADLKAHACVTYVNNDVAADRWYYLASLRATQTYLASDPPNYREVCRATMFLLPAEYKKVVPPKILAEIGRRHRLLGTKWVSNKFIAVVKDIAKVSGPGANRGKVFAYSPYMRGKDDNVADLIGKALVKWHGFCDVTREVIGKKVVGPYVNPSRRPCFVMWGKVKARGGSAGATEKAKLQHAFNHKDNTNGRHIKLYLACGEEYEGTDLKALRHLHVIEPMLFPLRERQLVGRAVRYCSHSLIPNPSVRIVRWFGTPPVGRVADLLPHVVPKHLEDTQAAMALHGQYLKTGGVEKALYVESMKDPAAVNLYNFELFLKKQANPAMTASFQSTFAAVAGRMCA